MTHRCHVPGCPVAVPPELLMCGKHWAAVPKALQREVWRHYRVGQCDDKNPSCAWHAAADAAIAHVVKNRRQPRQGELFGTRIRTSGGR